MSNLLDQAIDFLRGKGYIVERRAAGGWFLIGVDAGDLVALHTQLRYLAGLGQAMQEDVDTITGPQDRAILERAIRQALGPQPSRSRILEVAKALDDLVLQLEFRAERTPDPQEGDQHVQP